MPRSVYVVKGEGVRDSVWTPKASLSTLPAIPQSRPELVETIPSPNCSVNPVVQVFIQASSNNSNAHPRLAERSDGSRTPNNAVVTPSVVPLRTSPLLSSQSRVLQTSQSRTNGASAPFNDMAFTSRERIIPTGNLFHASRAAASNDIATGPGMQHHISTERSSNDSFRSYNGSLMIAAVLGKGAASASTRNVSRVEGSSGGSVVQNNPIPSMPSSGLDAPPRTGRRIETAPSISRGIEAGPDRMHHLRGSSVRKDSQSHIMATSLSNRPGLGALSAPGNRSSPSVSAKGNQTRSVSRSGLANAAVSLERKKAMQDIVDRRSAQRRAARSEIALLRPLKPLSKLLEKRPKSSGEEGTPKSHGPVSPVAKVPNNVPASSTNDIVPDKSSKPKSGQSLVSPRDDNVASAQRVSQDDVPGSQHQQHSSLKDKEEWTRQNNILVRVSQSETTEHDTGAAKSIPIPSQGQELAGPIRDGPGLGTRGSTTRALQSASHERRAQGEHHGSLKRIAEPDRASIAKHAEQPEHPSTKSGIHEVSFSSSQPLRTRKLLQRASGSSGHLRVAESQYYILVDSILALSSQIMRLRWHKSSSKTESELISTWKRRALEAIVSHYGETKTSLNNKMLRSSGKSPTSEHIQKRPALPEFSGLRKSRAVSFPRRSTSSEVQQTDIRSFRDMFQSWEEYMGEGSVQQFQADALHLKCVTEALREGKRVFLSDENVLPMFREFIHAKIGIEVITEKISMASTTLQRVKVFPSIYSWLRTTESILSWFAYLGNRMEVLLGVKDEPLASQLAAFCADFTRRLLSSSAQVNTEKGDALKIAGSLRTLKKVVATLPSSEEVSSGTQKTQQSNKLTAFLSQYVQSFRRLSVTMARHAMPPSPDASRSETSRSETRSAGPVQGKSVPNAKEDSSGNVQMSLEGQGRPESTRKHDVREERAVVSGVPRVVPQSRNSSSYNGTNQDDRLRRVAVNSEVMNKRASDHSAPSERARGKNMQRDMQNTSFPSIPRRPLNVDNAGRASRAQSKPSQSNDVTAKRVKTGPAATVHRMLVDATADTLVGSRKRKRGEGILQSYNDEAFGENGMRLNRPKRARVRFRVDGDGAEAPLPDIETIKTLYIDGSDLLGSRNALQEAAVVERAKKLSRRSVSRCFGFLRSFVSDLKSEMLGQPHVPSDFISDPYPPSAIRSLARI